jgi:hypothetical protein
MTTEEKLKKVGIHPQDCEVFERMSILAAEAYSVNLPKDLSYDEVWEEKLKYRNAYVDAMIDLTLIMNDKKVDLRRSS